MTYTFFTGSTLQVILHIENTISIVISAIIAVVYTLLGGLVSVAYTDVFQLFFIAFGLVSSLDFKMLKIKLVEQFNLISLYTFYFLFSF